MAYYSLYLFLCLAGEAEVHNSVYRKRSASVHTHAAVILDIEHIYYSAVLVSCNGNSAAKVYNDEIELIVWLAELLGCFLCH